MMELFEAGWRRSGFGDSEPELELYAKARAALARYHARLGEHDADPCGSSARFPSSSGPTFSAAAWTASTAWPTRRAASS